MGDDNMISNTNLTDKTKEGPSDTMTSMEKDSSTRKGEKLDNSKSIYNQDSPNNKTQEVSYNNSTNVHTGGEATKFDTVSHNSSYNNDTYCEEQERQKIKELKKLNYRLKENLNECQALLV